MITKKLFLIFLSIIFVFWANPTKANTKKFIVNLDGIEIPVVSPTEFYEISEISTETWKHVEKLTPPSNRLLGVFVSEEDLGLLMKGERPYLDRYMLLQTERRLETQNLTKKDFKELVKLVKDKEYSLFESNQNKIKSFLDAASSEVNVKIQIGEQVSLGVIFEQTNAIGLASLSKYLVQDKFQKIDYLMVTGTAYFLKNNKLFFGYVYSKFKSKDDLAWVKSTLEEWISLILKERKVVSQSLTHKVNKKSWEKAINAVKQLSKDHLEKARKGDARLLGTAFNEVDVPQHKCAILGRLLGKKHLISHLESPISESFDDAYEHLITSQSLSNWVSLAEYYVDNDIELNIKIWNLDCVGKLNIPNSNYIVEENTRTFYIIDGVNKHILRILGDVESGFAYKLNQAISENPGIKEVALGSGGGYIDEAITAGRIIRSHSLDTTLWNNCYSACTIVFLGGVSRTIWSPYPNLSFHKYSDVSGNTLPIDSDAYIEVYEYANEMGINADEFLRLTLSSEPDSFTDAEFSELCKSKITTWIQRSGC